jgi:hypothetical protein
VNAAQRGGYGVLGNPDEGERGFRDEAEQLLKATAGTVNGAISRVIKALFGAQLNNGYTQKPKRKMPRLLCLDSPAFSQFLPVYFPTARFAFALPFACSPFARLALSIARR